MRIWPRARAMRWVAALPLMSTMRALPLESTCVRSVIGRPEWGSRQAPRLHAVFRRRGCAQVEDQIRCDQLGVHVPPRQLLGFLEHRDGARGVSCRSLVRSGDRVTGPAMERDRQGVEDIGERAASAGDPLRHRQRSAFPRSPEAPLRGSVEPRRTRRSTPARRAGDRGHRPPGAQRSSMSSGCRASQRGDHLLLAQPVADRRFANRSDAERDDPRADRGRSAPGALLVRIRFVSAGGSSSSLRKALAAGASAFSCGGDMRSASPTMKTFRRAMAGVMDAICTRRRVVATKIASVPTGGA